MVKAELDSSSAQDGDGTARWKAESRLAGQGSRDDAVAASPGGGTNSGVIPPVETLWKEVVAKYQKPAFGRGLWQVVNTLVPYMVLWYVMYLSLSGSFWITFMLAVLAGGFLVRLFIIFHDCGHSSFFKSRRANDVFGFITGVLTWTPYFHWRWEHALHHASSGDLDRRGVGDIWTLTVQEYLAASRWRRFQYRLIRNPVILFGIAPIWLFAVRQRFSSPRANPRERHSVAWTNLGILGVALGLSGLFGWKSYLSIQLIIVAVAGSAGLWLFYVQHQFEGVYWERAGHWNYERAALRGSSYYRLPKILQWFSGNIGFHHIHHLSPRIPNYYLEKCHRAEPLFQAVKPITLIGSLKSFTFRLWDEPHGKLVGYRHLKNLRLRIPGARPR